MEPRPPTRWEREADSHAYAVRFERLAAQGQDLEGEARFIDALAPRMARVLDAGCGTGRTSAALARAGHVVVGVDRDEVLVTAARAADPSMSYAAHDLLDVTPGWLGGLTLPTVFDVIALVGNVMVYLAPGTEGAVLARLVDVLAPEGRIVAGFATDRAYTVADFDRDASAVGLQLQGRFATWHLHPWRDDADWCVTLLGRA